MNIDYSSAELAFREQVRQFIVDHLDPQVRSKVLAGRSPDKKEVVDWVKLVHRKGWAVPHWPAQHGGAEWSLVQQMIYRDVVHESGAPEAPSFGVSMVGPVIYTFGTRAQKERFLPRIANLTDWWCQGFSEPDAGSDLASLRTCARRSGDGWVLQGQKIWTTLAQNADWIFVLARTDPDAPRKQEGISFLLVDMRSPGVSVRPIRTLDGGAEINEVFFDGVEVPGDNLVGEENKGWTYAKFLLGNERIGQARVGMTKAKLRAARLLLEQLAAGSASVLRRANLEYRLVLLEVELRSLEMTQLRMLSSPSKSASLASVLKIKGSETLQAVTELIFDLSALSGLAGLQQFEHNIEGDDHAVLLGMAGGSYINHRKVTIYGGSSEIQRNIVAQSTMGV